MIQTTTQLDKRDRILHAASMVLARKGYAGTLISEIADTAGIGKGTVYEYFKNKEELFFAVFEWFCRESASTAVTSISTLKGSVSQRIAALGDAVMTQWIEQMDSFALIMEFWSASASSKIRDRFKIAFRDAYRDFRQLIEGFILEGIRSGEFRQEIDTGAVAASLVGTWDALILQRWFDTDFDPLYTSRHFIQVVLRGMSIENRHSAREDK